PVFDVRSHEPGRAVGADGTVSQGGARRARRRTREAQPDFVAMLWARQARPVREIGRHAGLATESACPVQGVTAHSILYCGIVLHCYSPVRAAQRRFVPPHVYRAVTV